MQLLTTSAVKTVAFSPDGHTLVAGSSDGTVRLWKVTNPGGATAIGLPVVDASPVSSVAFSLAMLYTAWWPVAAGVGAVPAWAGRWPD